MRENICLANTFFLSTNKRDTKIFIGKNVHFRTFRHGQCLAFPEFTGRYITVTPTLHSMSRYVECLKSLYYKGILGDSEFRKYTKAPRVAS